MTTEILCLNPEHNLIYIIDKEFFVAKYGKF